ncbi:SusD/RagB family nutrient-binding outer membrane lipoprotein [Bacteroides caecimuris]|uniref:SusD/RagB family nutrient-binding outer membrane lipoprotein n=1 Tax=Bacteroides caecimuris TaxID=1796613 RepID=UPI00265CAB63|nr:SusD/RagB family nutrient-binding outer membrane lipoprotein [Bacteroides caecimuris]
MNPDEYNATAPSNITVAWNESDDEEVKLERIITQKYLALYPNGQEAWSEWRRTGYPRQVPVVKNLTNAGVKTSDGYKDGVRRFTYPRSEYQQNNENLQKAIQQHLGGIDNASVNVWWDKKNK